ncbi:MAG: hypothetical protein UDG94_05705, partial [Peptococcaceae bacterium]|nr:hypothetical protein [Peptococcaceae bacterium]
MRKTKKRFLSALLACAMIVSLFPFAAFANDTTVNSPSELESAIASANDGDTITLEAGTYDLTTSPLIIEKRVNLVGAGADKTTIIGQVQYKFSEDQNGNTLTVSNLTIKPNATTDVQGLQFCGDKPNNGYNLNIVVENCVFDNWQYGITMNSHANGYDLTVKNCRFPSTLCAVSFNYDTVTTNQIANNSVEFDGTNIVDEGCYAVQKFNNNYAPESFSDKYFATVEDFNKDNAVETNPTLATNAVAKIGNTFYADLQSAVNAAPGSTATTIDLINDITLTQSIILASDQNITINGNGKTISYNGNGGTTSNAAFKITGSLDNEMGDTPENVSLTVNNVKFTSTAAGSNGYGVLVGANAKGANVKLDSCEFNNLYCGILVNPFTNLDKENVASISITNSTFSNTTYGYSIDESSEGKLVGAVQTTFTNNGEVTESEPWPSVEAYVTSDGLTTVAASFADAVTKAQSGDVITLAKDLESTTPISLPAGVTLDGNGHSLSYTGAETSAFLDVTTKKDNVTIKNVTINAGDATHAVQFYCNDGGTLENVTINGGNGTAVMVNGATDVSLIDSDLNPAEGAYANIEYGMGSGVEQIPSMSIDNVSFDGTKLYVWADAATTGRVETAMGGEKSNDEILAEILDNITYTNDNGGRLEISVGFDGEEVTSGSIESTYQPPYTGKYSYEINVADTDNGSVSVDKYATEGDTVTITVSPDKAYKLDELTVTANGKDVELTDNGDGTYTFTMPGSKVQISAIFVEDENYEEPTPEEPSSDMPFGDVNTGDWYYDVVKYAY